MAISNASQSSEPIAKLSICQEADSIVNGPRKKAYGDYALNLARISELTMLMMNDVEKEYLRKGEIPITVVSKILIALKLAREANSHKRDNLVDACGYLQLHGSLHGD